MGGGQHTYWGQKEHLTAEKENGGGRGGGGLLDDRVFLASDDIQVVGEEDGVILLGPLAGGQNAFGPSLHHIHRTVVHQQVIHQQLKQHTMNGNQG